MAPEFKCNMCGAVFTSQSELMDHAAKSHSQTSTPQYKCDKCGASFKTQEELMAHAKSSHAM